MKKISFISTLAIISLFLLTGCKQKEKNVLIIGDSISIGYFPFVKEAMSDNNNIVHNAGNAQHTGTGLQKLNEWLGETDWDLIAFNWGLWDLCFRHPDSELYGNRDKVNGTVTYSPEEYATNLDLLIPRLKANTKNLLFITTSYVPPGEGGRIEGDDIIYNKAALGIMKKHRIKHLDINQISKEIHKDHKSGLGDVHFTKEGYKLLAIPIIEKLFDLL